MTEAQILDFLGWATLWNLVILTASAIFIIPFRGTFSRIHASMFDVDAEFVRKEYFRYLAGYKVIVLAFFVVPYLVLRFMV